jgi:hypothetical protein
MARFRFQRRPREQLGGIVLFGAIIAQRMYLVADRGDHEGDCHDSKESDCLP